MNLTIPQILRKENKKMLTRSLSIKNDNVNTSKISPFEYLLGNNPNLIGTVIAFRRGLIRDNYEKFKEEDVRYHQRKEDRKKN